VDDHRIMMMVGFLRFHSTRRNHLSSWMQCLKRCWMLIASGWGRVGEVTDKDF